MIIKLGLSATQTLVPTAVKVGFEPTADLGLNHDIHLFGQQAVLRCACELVQSIFEKQTYAAIACTQALEIAAQITSRDLKMQKTLMA